ncbi:hypothetical protein ACEQPO_27375 [Bacillus sp. SL00103]
MDRKEEEHVTKVIMEFTKMKKNDTISKILLVKTDTKIQSKVVYYMSKKVLAH